MSRPAKKTELEKHLETLPVEKRKGRQKLTGPVSFDFNKNLFYVYLGLVDGKKKYKSFKTAKETELFLKEKDAIESRLGKSIANVTDITLKDYIIKYHKYRRYKTNTTKIFYNVLVNRICKYSIVKNQINEISADMLNEFFLEHEKNYAPSTVKKDYIFLNSVFARAYKEGVVSANRMGLVEPIYVPKPKPKTYTPEEIDMIIKYCLENFYQNPDRKRGTKHNYCTRVALIAALSGCRREEIMGLKFKNLHLDAPVPYMEIIDARTTIKEIEENLKTASSERLIPLCSILVDFFKKLKEEYDNNKEILGDKFHDTDYVICFENGKPVSVGTVTGSYKQAMAGCGLPNEKLYGYHVYRASIATNLRDYNAKSFQIQNFLGHSSLSTTEKYYFSKDKGIPDVPLNNIFKPIKTWF